MNINTIEYINTYDYLNDIYLTLEKLKISNEIKIRKALKNRRYCSVNSK